MSLNVLTQGGGAGGESASIFVTGLDEASTVSATKDGKVISAKWNSTENRFEITRIKEYGMWTVTASNGEETITQDVLVDAAVEYEIEMLFRLYLYREGDECEEVTGGWITQGLGLQVEHNVPQAPILTKNATNMVLSRTSATAYACGITLPQNKIDFTKYKTINIVVDFAGIASNDNCIFRGFFIKDKLGNVCNDGVRWFELANNVAAGSNKAMTGDISGCTGLFIPYISIYSRGSLTIRKIWLE